MEETTKQRMAQVMMRLSTSAWKTPTHKGEAEDLDWLYIQGSLMRRTKPGTEVYEYRLPVEGRDD